MSHFIGLVLCGIKSIGGTYCSIFTILNYFLSHFSYSILISLVYVCFLFFELKFIFLHLNIVLVDIKGVFVRKENVFDG